MTNRDNLTVDEFKNSIKKLFTIGSKVFTNSNEKFNDDVNVNSKTARNMAVNFAQPTVQ
jgi:hypothetical protein